MVFWGEFNPRTPNFNTIIIKTLVSNIDGMKLVIDGSKKTTFSLNGRRFTMTWDADFYGSESYFSFSLISQSNGYSKLPIIYNNRWFVDE